MEKQKQGGFDVLRIVLAFFVITLHTSLQIGNPLLEHMVRSTLPRLAVPMFFSMAGYFLFLKIPAPRLHCPQDRRRVRAYMGKVALLCVLWLPLYILFVRWPEIAAWWASLTPLLGLANVSKLLGNLWFLVALLVAVVIYYLLARRMRRWVVLVLALLLYIPLLLSESYQFCLSSPILMRVLWGFPSRALSLLDLHWFWGIPFVSLGAWMAERDVLGGKSLTSADRPSRSDLAGLVTSLLLFFGEVIAQYSFWKLSAELLVTLPLVCYFLMRVFARLWTKERPAYPFLRSASALIYYSHGFIILGIRAISGVNTTAAALFRTPMMEPIVLFLVSFAFAAGVLKLENFPRFRWLKKIH